MKTILLILLDILKTLFFLEDLYKSYLFFAVNILVFVSSLHEISKNSLLVSSFLFSFYSPLEISSETFHSTGDIYSKKCIFQFTFVPVDKQSRI